LARFRGWFWLAIVIGAAIYGVAKGRGASFCDELYAPLPYLSDPSERAGAMSVQIKRLVPLEKDPAFGGFAEVLDVIRDEGRFPFKEERGQQMIEAMKRTFLPFQAVVVKRCKSSLPYGWSSNVDAIARELTSRQKEQAQAIQEFKAAAEKREREQRTAVCQQSLATWAAARTPVAMSPQHYSKTGASRAGTAQLDQSGGRWQAKVSLAGDLGPNAQIDGIVTESSKPCLILKSDRGLSQTICGLKATLVTCNVASGELLGQTTVTLPPPKRLSVVRGGSVTDSARGILLDQLRNGTVALKWGGPAVAPASFRRPVPAPRPR
jgi:hypothetical protein